MATSKDRVEPSRGSAVYTGEWGVYWLLRIPALLRSWHGLPSRALLHQELCPWVQGLFPPAEGTWASGEVWPPTGRCSWVINYRLHKGLLLMKPDGQLSTGNVLKENGEDPWQPETSSFVCTLPFLSLLTKTFTDQQDGVSTANILGRDNSFI